MKIVFIAPTAIECDPGQVIDISDRIAQALIAKGWAVVCTPAHAQEIETATVDENLETRKLLNRHAESLKVVN